MSLEQITRTDAAEFGMILRANGLSEHTVRAYTSDILTFLDWVGPEGYTGPTEGMLARYINLMRSTWSPATTKRKLACFRAFGRFLGDPTFLADYKAPRVAGGVAHPLPGGVDDILTMVDRARLVHHKALIVLIGLLGCRVSEARSVRARDFDETSGDIVLTVRGKGDKTRKIPVDPKVMTLLDAALVEARERTDGLLVPITDRAARRAWTRIGVRAGVRPTATHDGRMTFGTASYDRSKDIRAVQELLGHSSVATTEGYTGISMSKLKAAAGVL